MKELSIEEKARRYDEAIEVAREYWNSPRTCIDINVLPKLFPELKESEDERIRKAIYDALSYLEKELSWDFLGNVDILDAYAWLEKQGEKDKYIEKELECIKGYREKAIKRLEEFEKQGEQKPAWSEEDERMYEGVVFSIREAQASATIEQLQDIYELQIKWLKDLKDRVLPQPKQEWSDEDNVRQTSTIQVLEFAHSLDSYNQYGKEDIRKNISWLKSLRPQNWTKEDKERYISCLQRLGTGNPEQPETINSKWFKEHVYPQSTWKPSDEQIKVLEFFIPYVTKCSVVLQKSKDTLLSLLSDLKKLREE